MNQGHRVSFLVASCYQQAGIAIASQAQEAAGGFWARTRTVRDMPWSDSWQGK